MEKMKEKKKTLSLVHQDVKFKLQAELSGKLPKPTPHTHLPRDQYIGASVTVNKRDRGNQNR